MIENLMNIFLFFAFYSFLGWLLETAFKSVNTRTYVNSGFLYGPFCPIYGVGALLVIEFNELMNSVMSNIHPVILILVGILIAVISPTIVEYLTGMLLEKLFKRRWWDYSEERFNIKGRVCLKYSLYWGIMAYLMLMPIHSILLTIIENMASSLKYVFDGLILGYFAVDFTVSVERALEWREFLTQHVNVQALNKKWEDFYHLMQSRLNLTVRAQNWFHYRIQTEDAMEFNRCINDLIVHDSVQHMKEFRHHYSVTCFEHSLSVSFYSFVICRRLGWDYIAAARGGLLHDLFLYDWRATTLDCGRHGFVHPRLALENASKIYSLNDLEKDIILKHMFPLTLQPPVYKESLVVCMVDKFCTVEETVNNYLNTGLRRAA